MDYTDDFIEKVCSLCTFIKPQKYNEKKVMNGWNLKDLSYT